MANDTDIMIPTYSTGSLFKTLSHWCYVLWAILQHVQLLTWSLSLTMRTKSDAACAFHDKASDDIDEDNIDVFADLVLLTTMLVTSSLTSAEDTS